MVGRLEVNVAGFLAVVRDGVHLGGLAVWRVFHRFLRCRFLLLYRSLIRYCTVLIGGGSVIFLSHLILYISLCNEKSNIKFGTGLIGGGVLVSQ